MLSQCWTTSRRCMRGLKSKIRCTLSDNELECEKAEQNCSLSGRITAGRRVITGVCLKEYLFLLLAFGNPGFAPDEHRSRTLTYDWSCHGPHQEMRREELLRC